MAPTNNDTLYGVGRNDPLPEVEARAKANGKEPIKVWQFSDAPEALQKLSTNGGDEDWLALLPPGMNPTMIMWLDDNYGGFGNFIDTYNNPPGYPHGSTVVIGSDS